MHNPSRRSTASQPGSHVEVYRFSGHGRLVLSIFLLVFTRVYQTCIHYISHIRTVAGVWRRRYSWIVETLQDALQEPLQDILQGLSTGRLAGGKDAEKLWPLNRTIERRIPVGLGHRRCRMVAWGVCFNREFEFGVFAMGKWLRIACFPTSVFLVINVFLPLLEKESSNFPPPRVSNLPFQYPSALAMVHTISKRREARNRAHHEDTCCARKRYNIASAYTYLHCSTSPAVLKPDVLA